MGHVHGSIQWRSLDEIRTRGRWRHLWSPPSQRFVDERYKSGSDAGLKFFPFDGSHDGEDIKHDFKTQLSEMEVLLKPEEGRDIVCEAEVIFNHCALLMEELDIVMAVQRSTEPMSLAQLSLRHLPPMGMVGLS